MECVNVSNDIDFTSEVKLSADVIATLAALATIEADGIEGIAGSSSGEMIKKRGIRSNPKGVAVSFTSEGKSVSVKISAVMKYGYSIPDVCASVKERVSAAIESMSGIKVDMVSIDITDVAIPKQ